jgi:hypothetical protein
MTTRTQESSAAPSLSIRDRWTWAARLPFPVVLFIAAAVFRLIAFAIFYTSSVLAGQHGLIDPFDSVGIDNWAWYAAQHFRSGTWVDLRSNTLEGTWDVGFTYLVAFEYTIVGHHPEVARVLDCLLAAFSSPAAYLAARATSIGEKVASRAGWLVACWPLSLYWAGYDLLKDPLVWFFLSIGLVALTTASWRRRAGSGAIAAGGVHIVRNYMGPMLAILLLLAAVLRRDWKAVVATLAALAIVEAAIIAAGFPPAWSLGPYLATPEVAVGSQPSTPGQASTGIPPLRFTPIALAKRFAVGIPTVLFGPGLKPLKDFLHPTLDWGMYPGLFPWIALIPFTLLGLWRTIRRRDPTLWSIALFSVAIWGSLALFYAGHATRQREMAFPATLILTSFGLERPWPRRWWWLYAAYWLAVLAGLAWEAGLV